MTTVTLAYHGAASEEAADVAAAVARLGWTTEHYVCGTAEGPGALGRRLLAADGQVLLFLNDDLLHAVDCQVGLLDAYRRLRTTNRLHCVLASSRRPGPGGQGEARVLTTLSRVSDVVRYMNYWQHAYLEQRRAVSADEADGELLERVRLVSQEIGETLRLVRGDGYAEVHELTDDDSSVLSTWLGELPAASQSISAERQAAPANRAPASDPVAAIADANAAGATGSGNGQEPILAEGDTDAAGVAASVAAVRALSREVDEVVADGGALHDDAPSAHVGPGDNETVVADAEHSDRSAYPPLRQTDSPAPPPSPGDPAEPGSQLVDRPAEDAAPASAARGDNPRDADHGDATAGASADGGEEQTLVRAVAVAAAAVAASDSLRSESVGDRDRSEARDPEAERERARRRAAKAFVKRLRRSDVAAALAFGRAALAEDPGNERLRYALAIGLLSDGDAEEDVVEARDLLIGLTAGGERARAHAALGALALGERDYGSARRHLAEAYRDDPACDPELAYRLGALLQDEFPEKRKAARRCLKKATRYSRRNAPDAWYRLGALERERGKWKRAARAFKTAASLDRDHPFAAYELATLYLERDRIARATRYFRRAVRANPELDTLANRQAFAPPTPELESDGFDRYLERAQRTGSGVQAEAEPFVPRGFNLADGPAAEATPSLGASASARPTIDSLLEEEWRQRQLTVLITGATSGIGAATAKAFARGGHRLILTGRRVPRLREVSLALREAHDCPVRLLSYDVTDLRQTSELLETLPADWRDVDVLVNNAGKAKGLDPIHRGRLEHWEEMIDTNVKGVLYMTRLVTPGMVKRGRGHVINVCSTAGHEVYPNGAVYCATKHAVDAITQGTRLDLHKYGIRVSQVSPAHVEETEFARVRFDGDADRAAGVYEGFRPLRAADVARAIYFMATQPPHVNVQDVLMMGTQQASSTVIDRSGR